MLPNENLIRRSRERKLFLAAAILFPAIILAGFARTYYLKEFFTTPGLPTLVHVHGLVMSSWVALFVAQVFLIRSRNVKLHMKLGTASAALAVLIIVIGFFTALMAAKNGSSATPPDIPRLAFLVVPLFDLLMFAILFGGAFYYRKKPAEHKRLMLLAAINFLPPAAARIPVASLNALGPLWFFGLPTILILGCLAWDRRHTGKYNKIFIAGSVLLIASYPFRLWLMGTDAWMQFAGWLTSFV